MKAVFLVFATLLANVGTLTVAVLMLFNARKYS